MNYQEFKESYKNFSVDIKKGKLTALLFLVVSIFFIWKFFMPDSLKEIRVNGNGNATVVGDNSRAQVNNYSNIDYEFTWQNKDAITSTRVVQFGPNVKYLTPLIFKASVVLPKYKVCSIVTTANTLGMFLFPENVDLTSVTKNEGSGNNDSYSYTLCFLTTNVTQTLNIESSDIPKVLNAKMVQD